MDCINCFTVNQKSFSFFSLGDDTTLFGFDFVTVTYNCYPLNELPVNPHPTVPLNKSFGNTILFVKITPIKFY